MENSLMDIFKDTINEQKRVNKRYFIIILVLIALLLFTNASWLLYESQFSDGYNNAELHAEDGELNVEGSNNIGGTIK